MWRAQDWASPGGSLVKNPPADAGDPGSVLAPGGLPCTQSEQAHARRLESCPYSLQLEESRTWRGRHSTAKNIKKEMEEPRTTGMDPALSPSAPSLFQGKLPARCWKKRATKQSGWIPSHLLPKLDASQSLKTKGKSSWIFIYYFNVCPTFPITFHSSLHKHSHLVCAYLWYFICVSV